jgi:hypothetical protein
MGRRAILSAYSISSSLFTGMPGKSGPRDKRHAFGLNHEKFFNPTSALEQVGRPLGPQFLAIRTGTLTLSNDQSVSHSSVKRNGSRSQRIFGEEQ